MTMSDIQERSRNNRKQNADFGKHRENTPWRKRYHILDEIRGLVLIHMILFHTIWDMVYIYHYNMEWFRSDLAYIWQQWICCTFIVLSGFCWNLGKRKVRRGIIVFGCGLLVTAVTIIFTPESRVVFGVLTLLGSCMLFLCPLDKVLQRVKPGCGVIFCGGLFLIFRNINKGYLGFGEWKPIKLPAEWYADFITTYWGFPSSDFYSTDYFPVFPWFFLFCMGYFLYACVKKRRMLECLETVRCRALEVLGEHSLKIYMVHQPIIMLVLHIFC